MIAINEDFEKAYKDGLIKGFTLQEGVALLSGVAVLAGICYTGFFILGWNLYLSFFLGMPFAAAAIIPSFWKSASDLTLKEYFAARAYRKKTGLLKWKSSEYGKEMELLEEIMSAVEEKEKKEK